VSDPARGAVALLRDNREALRLRMDGPAEARMRQATRLDRDLDQAGAEQTLRQFDRTHAAYLQQFYGADIHDWRLYHVVLDSTAIELEACVELIVRAARSLNGARRASLNGSQ
jgi:cytidylate kinase